MLRPAYLSQKLARPLPTKDGGTLRTVAEARAYMLGLSKARELRAQWQRAAELLLGGMWTLAFGQHEDRTPTHGYEATREAAMAAFAKGWRRE